MPRTCATPSDAALDHLEGATIARQLAAACPPASPGRRHRPTGRDAPRARRARPRERVRAGAIAGLRYRRAQDLARRRWPCTQRRSSPSHPEGMRLQAAVAVVALAAEGQLDRLAEHERAQLLLRRDLQRPRAGLGAGIDRARRQRPDQPQLGAVIERHRLAVDDARHRARRARLQAGARDTPRSPVWAAASVIADRERAPQTRTAIWRSRHLSLRTCRVPARMRRSWRLQQTSAGLAELCSRGQRRSTPAELRAQQ